MRLLHELGMGAALAPHARAVHGVRLHGHGVHVRIDFPQPGWSLPRAVLDKVLLDAALDAGANVLHGRVENCAQDSHPGTLAIRRPDGALEHMEARTIVGADGMHSIVARKCGLAEEHRGRSRFALGGHYGGFDDLDEYIDMFVDGRSYVAINPLSSQSANVMLIVEEEELERHRSGVEAFAEECARRLAGKIFATARLEGKRLAIGPLGYRARRLTAGCVLLAGDAAAFVDPFTGQGVYLALRCARIAAESILCEDLQAYERRAGREIGSRRRAAGSVARLIGSPLLSRAAALLMRGNSWPIRPLVRRVTGAA